MRPLLQTFSGSLAGIVATAIGMVLVVRHLGPAGWGTAAAGMGLATSISLLFAGGLAQSSIKRVSAGQEDDASFTRLMAGCWTICLFGLVGVECLLFLIQTPLVAEATASLTAALSIRQLAAATLSFGQRFGTLAIVTVIERVTGTAILVGAVALNAGPAAIIFAQVLAPATTATWLSRRWFHGHEQSFRFVITGLLTQWWSAIPFALPVAALIVGQLDVQVVSLVSGRTEAGYFALGARVVLPVALLGSAAATVLLPVVSSNVGEAALRMRVRKTGLIVGAMCLVSLLAAAFVVLPHALRLLGGSYAPAIDTLRLYVIASGLVAVTQPIFATLQALGLQRWVGIVLISGSAVSLTVAAVGAASAGARGAAFGYLVSNGLLLVVGGIRLRRQLHFARGVVADGIALAQHV